MIKTKHKNIFIGNLFIKGPRIKLFQDIKGIDKRSLIESIYGKIDDNELMIQIGIESVRYNHKFDDVLDWTYEADGMPNKLVQLEKKKFYSKNIFRWSEYIPLSLIKDLKESDMIKIELNKSTIILIARQNYHRNDSYYYHNHDIFESVLRDILSISKEGNY